MTEAQREQRRYALAISGGARIGGGFRNYFTGVKHYEYQYQKLRCKNHHRNRYA